MAEKIQRDIEVLSGPEEIIRKTLEGFSSIKDTFDICTDHKGPSVFLASPPIWQSLTNLKERGVRIRLVTEVTRENISHCKALMTIANVRHLDSVKGNFGIGDGTEYRASAENQIGQPPAQLIRTSMSAFVEQQQYFFDLLWTKAIPADQRVIEIEEGRETEKTEVWRDQSIIMSKSLEILANLKKQYDFCIDWRGPSIIMSFDYIKNAYLDIVNRGGKLRLITEIIPQNISFCEDIARFAEIRHLDNIKGNFGIVDGKIYGGTSTTTESRAPSSYLHSTVREFVEQQQYFFDMLWEKAVPAKERILEIREGTAPAKIEVMRDVQASIGRAFEIMKTTSRELEVLFATPRTFMIAMKMGVPKIYSDMIDRGVNIRILVPKSSANNQLNDIVSDIKKAVPRLDLRLSDGDLNTRISLMVSDRREFMAWELRDDSKEDPYEAGGAATYSNSEALASSYATIFNNLWKISDMADNLVATNLKLHESQNAMKEFINIAAHELRSPIQPILGLAEVLAGNKADAGTPLLRVIIRNAKRLQDLSERILDVTKIESNMLRLNKQKLNLNRLVAEVVQDAKKSLLVGDGTGDTLDIQYALSDPIFVNADPTRLHQVLSNLLDNAIKFTAKGSIRVDFRLIEGKVVVKVCDSGRGIDPVIMPRLFEKFVSKSDSGTGLGLFICKSIIEAHGGIMHAENNSDGKGATVTFTLPAAN